MGDTEAPGVPGPHATAAGLAPESPRARPSQGWAAGRMAGRWHLCGDGAPGFPTANHPAVCAWLVCGCAPCAKGRKGTGREPGGLGARQPGWGSPASAHHQTRGSWQPRTDTCLRTVSTERRRLFCRETPTGGTAMWPTDCTSDGTFPPRPLGAVENGGFCRRRVGG